MQKFSFLCRVDLSERVLRWKRERVGVNLRARVPEREPRSMVSLTSFSTGGCGRSSSSGSFRCYHHGPPRRISTCARAPTGRLQLFDEVLPLLLLLFLLGFFKHGGERTADTVRPG